MNLMGMPMGAMGMFGPKKMARGGLFGAGGMMLGQDKPQEEEKSYFDTTGGKMALIGDVLLRASGKGGNPMVQYAMQQQLMKQRANQQQQLAETKRRAGMQDWFTKQKWERANPKPVAPTAMERNFQTYQSMTPEQQAAFLKYQDVVNPVMATTWQGPQVVPRNAPSGPALSDIEAELKRRGVQF